MAGQKQAPIYLSLSPTSPGVQSWARGLAGEEFVTLIAPAIVLDPSRRYTATVLGANVFFSSPNVSQALGREFSFSNTNALAGPLGTFTITLATGLYAFSDVANAVASAALALGFGTDVSPEFSFGANTAAGLISITVRDAGISIDLTADSSIGALLGFAAAVGPTVGAGEVFVGDTRADFPRGTTSYRIHCDLVSGSYLGGSLSDSILSVPLDAAPNSQIVLTPGIAARVPVAPRSIVDSVRVYLTNQSGVRIANGGEAYDLTLMIEEL